MDDVALLLEDYGGDESKDEDADENPEDGLVFDFEISRDKLSLAGVVVGEEHGP